MTTRKAELDLDGVIMVDKIPGSGRTLIIKTDAEQRELIAKRFNVISVEEFDAKILATRFKGGIQATGTVSGKITQHCVVTGDPVEQTISEEIDRIYLPVKEDTFEATAGSEIFVNLEEDDLPDYFDNNQIDLADLAMEVFAIAIDLYPRKEGVELTADLAGDDPAELSPFAALKALQKD